MNDDWTLLGRFVEHADQQAFAELARRHTGLVFSAALRQTASRETAEEVAQAVFVLLARKAPTLRPEGALAGWLHRCTFLIARKHGARDRARRRRERSASEEVMTLQADHATGVDPTVDWDAIAPSLDLAMQALEDGDRTAVLLRFFQGSSLREVGEALGVGEDAARKRVGRAVGRLRDWYGARGVPVTSIALSAALSERAVGEVPSHLVGAVIHATGISPVSAGAASTTASLLASTMTTTKFLLPAALLVGALLPVSVEWLRSGDGSASSGVGSDARARGTGPSTGLDDRPATGLIAEWERLLSEHGPEAGGSLADVYGVVAGIGDAFRRSAFRGALITQWLAEDPDAALEHVIAHDPDQAGDLLVRWLESDPEGCVAGIERNASPLRQRQIGPLLATVARIAPDSLPVLAQMVERSGSWTHEVRDAFVLIAQGDPKRGLELANRLTGPQFGEALAGVALGWAESDPPAALAWAGTLGPELDGEARGWILRSLLTGWAKREPAAALDRLDLAPPGGSTRELANDTGGQVLRAAAAADFGATLDWMARNPGALSRESLTGLRDALAPRFAADPVGTLDMIRDHGARDDLIPALGSLILNEGFARADAVWDWLSTQQPGAFVDETRGLLLQSAAASDPARALRWLGEAESGVDPLRRHDLLEELVRDAGGPANVSELLAVAPDSMRGDVMAAAFNLLPNSVAGGAGEWVDRLGEVPTASRPQAVAALARFWAGSDPLAAAEWASTIGDPVERTGAMDGVMRGWIAADSHEASRWVADLKSGPVRDEAAGSLVTGVAGSDPESAWEWAASIESTRIRLDALATAFAGLADRDLGAALDRLRDPALSDADVEALGEAAEGILRTAAGTGRGER